MSYAVFGPGLVGSYLGAAGAAELAYVGPSGLIRATRVRLPSGVVDWRPRQARFPNASTSNASPAPALLIATRVHRTPWADLPSDALAAQNGLGQPRAVVVCFFALDVGGDGVIEAVGPRPRVVLARPGKAWEPILARWSDTGLIIEVLDDARPAQWEKAILNATVGPLCLATGMGMGAVWADQRMRELTLRATTEGAIVAAAHGVDIPRGIEERASAFFERVGAHRPSVLRDTGELPHILGELQRSARRHGVPTVSLDAIARMVEQRVVALTGWRVPVGASPGSA